MESVKQVIKFITEQKIKPDGKLFLNNLVQFLGNLIKTEYVIINIIEQDNLSIAKTLAIYSKGNTLPNFEYQLKNTPCENVIGKTLCTYNKNIQKLFPKDAFLAAKNINSYIGIPLWDSKGKAIGHIAIMDSKEMQEIETIELILQVVAIRVSQEIEKNIFQKIQLKTKNKYKEIFKNSQDVIYQTNLNGKVTFISPSIKKITGYEVKETIGVNIAKMLYKNNDYKNLFLKKLRKDGFINNYDNILIRKDGTTFWASICAHYLKNNNGKVIGVEGIIKDVSKRKAHEIELVKLSRVVEQSPVSVIITNTESKIEYVNQKFSEITGYTSSEIIGLTPVFMQSGNTSDLTYKNLWESILKGKSWNGELQNRKKNGDLYWERVLVSPITDQTGNITNFIAIKEDITKRKLTEEALIEAIKKAEESARLKSAFLANVSHEIRTPMNSILGFTGLLRQSEINEEKKKKYLSVIEKSGDRLLNFIDDIITFSKIETEQITVDSERLNLNKLTESIYALFKPETEKKGLQLYLKNQLQTEDTFIYTDKEKIIAIITNLVKNAIKFTCNGSIEFGYEKHKKFITFFVKDTGQGISMDQKEIIFERFRQGSESLSRNYDGAGMGLCISKTYVELLGGKIWVESEAGKGSVFYFTLPKNIDSEKIYTTEKTLDRVNLY